MSSNYVELRHQVIKIIQMAPKVVATNFGCKKCPRENRLVSLHFHLMQTTTVLKIFSNHFYVSETRLVCFVKVLQQILPTLPQVANSVCNSSSPNKYDTELIMPIPTTTLLQV